MRKIKEGSECVTIARNQSGGGDFSACCSPGKTWRTTVDHPHGGNHYFCLAPDPDYGCEYEVGDWALPVLDNGFGNHADAKSHPTQLLRPFKIAQLGLNPDPEVYEVRPALDTRWWRTKNIVPVRRRGDKIYIGCEGETVLPVEVYRARYGVEELPAAEVLSGSLTGGGVVHCKSCGCELGITTTYSLGGARVCGACYTTSQRRSACRIKDDIGLLSGVEGVVLRGITPGKIDIAVSGGNLNHIAIALGQLRPLDISLPAGRCPILPRTEVASAPPVVPGWQPSRQDYLDICGRWRWPSGLTRMITPGILNGYLSRADAFAQLRGSGGERYEEIPPQAVPGHSPPPMRREFYSAVNSYPLLYESDAKRPGKESSVWRKEKEPAPQPGERYPGCDNVMFPVDNIRPRKEEPAWWNK